MRKENGSVKSKSGQNLTIAAMSEIGIEMRIAWILADLKINLAFLSELMSADVIHSSWTHGCKSMNNMISLSIFYS